MLCHYVPVEVDNISIPPEIKIKSESNQISIAHNKFIGNSKSGLYNIREMQSARFRPWTTVQDKQTGCFNK